MVRAWLDPEVLLDLLGCCVKLLTPYGFRPPRDNRRHGYAICTPLLSSYRLPGCAVAR